MSEWERVLARLDDLKREIMALRSGLHEVTTPLGFGVKEDAYTYLFINPPSNPLTGNPADLWYLRSRGEGVNRVIPEDNLTAFVETLYRCSNILRHIN